MIARQTVKSEMIVREFYSPDQLFKTSFFDESKPRTENSKETDTPYIPPTPALQASVKALLLGRASKTSQIRSVPLLGRRSVAADVGQVSLLALR
jgi:hypothetical protein